MTSRRILATMAIVLGAGLCVPAERAQSVTCDDLVTGTPIAAGQTYSSTSVAGPSLCTTNAAANKFGACSTIADCGGTAGSCVATPWLTVDGIPFSVAAGGTLKFNITAAAGAPGCEHTTCVNCGGPLTMPCPGTPGDLASACCPTPGYIAPSFCIPTLNYCSRVDQTGYGAGVVNTSSPQGGNNEVRKTGDTSDPGANCTYGGCPADPPYAGCTNPNVLASEGSDAKGKIVRTIGLGGADIDGNQIREQIPIASFTWSLGKRCSIADTLCASAANCPGGETCDIESCPSAHCGAAQAWGGTAVDGVKVTGFSIKLDLSTAGAEGQFVDMDADTCCAAGSGFLGGAAGCAVGGTYGPITVTETATPAAVSPQPYAGGGFQMAAVQPIFPGAGPLWDLGFVNITPYGAPTLLAPEACVGSPVAGCPE